MKTFVKRHAVVISYDPKAIDETSIDKAIFSPTTMKFATPKAGVDSLSVVRIGVEGLHDKMDMVYFGAILRLPGGEEFMDKYHPMKSLAPRDVTARAIYTEMTRRGEDFVYLDVRHKDPEQTRRHFPNIYEKCLSLGIDITRDLIPVTPAAHYCCGGVKVDTNGETSIRHLYALGETSCTGLHGLSLIHI